jgi:hypothetical protein
MGQGGFMAFWRLGLDVQELAHSGTECLLFGIGALVGFVVA